MAGISVERSPAALNPGANTEQAAEIARQGQVGNRRVSGDGDGHVGPIGEVAQVDNATVATPISARSVSLVPDDPANLPVSWFTEHLPFGTGTGGTPPDSFPLAFRNQTLAGDMKNVVHFAEEIDKDILRASELLEKSEHKPLNEKEQREVNTLLGAGKYNLEQVQRWASVARSEFEGHPAGLEFMTKLQERLADRHMDLADLMCLYDLDQAPPEQAVSRADRVDHNLVAADAAFNVARGLTAVSGLSEEAQQQMVAVLEEHRDGLGKAKDIVIDSSSDSAQVLSKAVWDSVLTKGKKAGDSMADLHKQWDAKAAGATGDWLPLAHPRLTQEQMLQGFVSYQLKRAGVAKKDRSDLKFQFKEATNRVRNERPWAPIEKQLHYTVMGGEPRTAHSKITPAKVMAGAERFTEDLPANGICCGDRMQYTHVPNLARTELTDASGNTLFSALRHGVLDAYDISASTLCKLPEQELFTTVRDLLVPPTAKKAVSEELRIASEGQYSEIDFDGGASQATSTGKADDGANANPTVLTYGEGDYATIQRATPREAPPEVPPHSEEAWESTIPFSERAFADPYWESPPELDTVSLDAEDAVTPGENPDNLRSAGDGPNLVPGQTEVSDTARDLRVEQIVDEIRTNPAQASKYASDMRTAASQNMAKELAVAALVGDPDKLQQALDGKVVDLNLSSVSLLTPDLFRKFAAPKSNERQMLRRQTEALKSLDNRNKSSEPTSLRVRNASGELRTVQVNCKVRTFNFGVNAGAVGRAKHIPSHLRGWDKLMGWSYAMERNNPELRTLLGDPRSGSLGGDVQEKLTELKSKLASLEERGVEFLALHNKTDTLETAATAAKEIWREGSYNKGGQDPYKMVSRLGMVINEMGETLAFNCKSGKDRTGQLDAELKYLTAINATGYHPDPGARVTPELRQMRSDFTLNSGNLEMQRINTGLPGFKLDIKEVPGLANFIDPGMESRYRGGSNYIKS